VQHKPIRGLFKIYCSTKTQLKFWAHSSPPQSFYATNRGVSANFYGGGGFATGDDSIRAHSSAAEQVTHKPNRVSFVTH